LFAEAKLNKHCICSE